MTTRALFTYTALFVLILAAGPGAFAQESDAPKAEIGVQFSSLSVNLPGFGGTQNAPGFGARVTYNLNDYFAVEAEGNVFPTGVRRDYVTGGAAQQAQFGAKVGKRWRSFGLFGKARPGFVSFGETLTPLRVESGGVTFFQLGRERKTHFSMDVGGVLEFYPSRRTVVRFDAGDTIIRYGEHAEFLPILAPSPVSPIGAAPSEMKHNFQFTAGVGYRFGGGGDGGGASPSSASASGRRFEAGIQFSSLVLRPPQTVFGPVFDTFGDGGSEAEAGFGARVGYNVTDELAFEAEGNFYPRRRFGLDTAVGGYPSQLQAGVKYGRRFERFGLFAKARPGFVNFSKVASVTRFESTTFFGQQFFFPVIEEENKTYFSMDVGGVLEFYPTRRFFTRFDAGDTMIRYPERDILGSSATPTPPRLPAELRHNLQFTAGIGLRF